MKATKLLLRASIALLLSPRLSFAQAKAPRELRVPYPIAGGMDFYRDDRNEDKVLRFMGEFYKSDKTEELEETRRAYSRVTPGLPIITAKAIDNAISSDKVLSTMNLKGADMLDVSFLQKLEEERKTKGR